MRHIAVLLRRLSVKYSVFLKRVPDVTSDLGFDPSYFSVTVKQIITNFELQKMQDNFLEW